MKQDTILGHSLARAFLATGDQAPTPWKLAKLTPKASRATALIVMWAIALEDRGVEELHVEEYVAWAASSRATVHRHLRDFRELWPEYDTPNELARMVLKAAGDSRPSHTTLVPA